jgi:hypothetical protein
MATPAEVLAQMSLMFDELKTSLNVNMKALEEKVAGLEGQVTSLQARAPPDREVSQGESHGEGSRAPLSRVVALDSGAIPGAISLSRAAGEVSLASDSPLSSFDLATAASSWAAHKEVKLRALAKLGKSKDELPFGRWKFMVLADLDAARLTPVLAQEFPVDASHDVQGYYRAANAVLFSALVHSVSSIAVLSDAVMGLFGNPSSSCLAWRAIKAHFVRLSSNNRLFLLSKVEAFEPRDGEDMESFLNRGNLLRSEFVEYGLAPDDGLMIAQVLRKLSIQWKSRANLDGPQSDLTWPQVAEALQKEDNDRRQSNTKHPEALQPLGWTRRSGEARVASSGGDPSKEQPSVFKGQAPLPADASAAPAFTRKGKAPKGAQPKGERTGSAPVVCWHCLKVGHLWGECNTKPEGWRWSPEDRAKADALRDEWLRRRQQSHRDKAVHVARATSQSESPTEASCSAAL